MTRQRPAVWMITFGDLLTLLLCFFLTMVTFGALGPKTIPQRKQPVTEATARDLQDGNVDQSGILLAGNDSETGSGVKNAPFRVTFEEQDLNPQGLKTKLEGLNGTERKGVTLKTCGADWNIAMRRALETFENLGALGWSPRVQVLGGLCGLLQKDGQLAAVMVFE